MGRIMFPFSERELAARESDDKPKKEWKPQGCFKQRPMTPRERQLRADNTRLWLSAALHEGPMPAVEVLQLAAKAGVNEWSLRRAKRHLRIKAVKVGGKRQGWGAKWFRAAGQVER